MLKPRRIDRPNGVAEIAVVADFVERHRGAGEVGVAELALPKLEIGRFRVRGKRQETGRCRQQ
jgi:hypothetical protein